ncbi:GNAT family N-acetyltransferase [Glycomyces buryatensis]|uniref:GNAT family N-acetyltransferase n=1 Tax=Glycomyces buryatensis TaxID=2570927 RepID=A0A4S8Q9M3_9ACTN|nr:GNAT family N-acetyltransferase [Glycomyces buryatensis]THV40151.1 GNAT family N-acetyltransferase [Glycomyces buryatensis]
MTGLRIVEVEPPELAAVHRDLLTPNFPPHELGPESDLVTEVEDGTASALASVDADGNREGVAVGHWDAAHRVWLLSHLAVDPARRAGGVGGRLLDAVVERWAKSSRPCAVLAEVEHPASVPGKPAWGDPRRRFEFYVRHGARVLNLPYFQPALGKKAERAYGMLLVVLHLDREFQLTADRVSPVPVRGFLEDYFRSSEGGLPDDPAGLALLASTERPGGIELIDPATTPIGHLPRSHA